MKQETSTNTINNIMQLLITFKLIHNVDSKIHISCCNTTGTTQPEKQAEKDYHMAAHRIVWRREIKV